jgi:hypothetical protein
MNAAPVLALRVFHATDITQMSDVEKLFEGRQQGVDGPTQRRLI